jgi:hypothetical protein
MQFRQNTSAPETPILLSFPETLFARSCFIDGAEAVVAAAVEKWQAIGVLPQGHPHGVFQGGTHGDGCPWIPGAPMHSTMHRD